MKKILTTVLLTALVLSGCGETTAPKKETTPSFVETTPTETTETVYTEPEETEPVEQTEPATEPEISAEPQETEPVPSEPVQSPQSPAVPQQPTTPPVQDKPQTTTPPAQAKPQVTPARPSGSGRPTSSATGRDTGSGQIWEDPDADTPDPYEENDPERVAYREYLAQKGNEYLYWLQQESMLMHVGRSYGMPLYTGLELMEGSVWVSSDPTVATVNAYGFVVALKPGITMVSVSYEGPLAEGRCFGECEVVVEGVGTYTYAQLEQKAHQEAKLIADYAMHYENATTDLERIGLATALVHQYVRAGKGGSEYRIVDGELTTYYFPGYNQPFGTLVTFRSTCAGDVRALGLVLEYMGFQWYHVNEGKWDHQWCVVYDVDGQTAFADASFLGIVGYGERKDDQSNWQRFENGGLR